METRDVAPGRDHGVLHIQPCGRLPGRGGQIMAVNFHDNCLQLCFQVQVPGASLDVMFSKPLPRPSLVTASCGDHSPARRHCLC